MSHRRSAEAKAYRVNRRKARRIGLPGPPRPTVRKRPAASEAESEPADRAASVDHVDSPECWSEAERVRSPASSSRTAEGSKRPKVVLISARKWASRRRRRRVASEEPPQDESSAAGVGAPAQQPLLPAPAPVPERVQPPRVAASSVKSAFRREAKPARVVRFADELPPAQRERKERKETGQAEESLPVLAVQQSLRTPTRSAIGRGNQ